MAEFTVKVGTETVTCSQIIAGSLIIRYKGKGYIIEPDENGWKRKVGNLDDEKVQAIGKAIEKYLMTNH